MRTKSVTKKKTPSQKVLKTPITVLPVHHLSPKDVFMHLLVIILLYFFAASFLTLLFQYVNVWWPDQLFSTADTINSGPLRFALASLVIVFPTFFIVSWLLDKEYRRDTSARQMRLRKWLIYFTLFVATLIIGGDLVSIIYNFLEGELTMRFFLKAVAVFLVAGIIFGYYVWDVRQAQPSNRLKYFAWPVGVLVSVVIIGGFWLAGSPQQQRLYRLDEQRIGALQQIQSGVISYWQEHNALPITINDIANYLKLVNIYDPISGQAYEYHPVANTTYKLCANFSRTNNESVYPVTENWNHPAGYYCFSRVIDETLYPSARPVQ